MAEVVANQAPEIQTSGSGGLKRGALGLIAAAGIGIVVMGPVGTPYGIYGAMDASSGKVVPFLMILTAFLMIPSGCRLPFCHVTCHLQGAALRGCRVQRETMWGRGWGGRSLRTTSLMW